MEELQLAIQETVKAYKPGKHKSGAAELAKRLALSEHTVYNKANPNCEHQFTLPEARAVMLTTDNYSILHALAADCGYATFPLGDFANCSDTELLTLYSRYHSDIGNTAEEFHLAIEDGRFSRAEFQRINQAFIKQVRAGLELMTRIKALIDDEA